MGLHGNILRAVDGSIFTFDKIYTINTDLLTIWGWDKKDPPDSAQKEILTILEEYNSIRKLTQAQVMTIMNYAANIDNIYTGRYVFVEELYQVYVKTFRDDKYEYVLIADLSTLNILDDANTDEWLNIRQDGNDLYDIKLVHSNPGPPVEVDGKYITFKDSEYYLPENEGGAGANRVMGIALNYFDKKGHNIKESITEVERYWKDVSDFINETNFVPDALYVAFHEYTVNETDGTIQTRKKIITKSGENADLEINGYHLVSMPPENGYESDEDIGTKAKYNNTYKYFIYFLEGSDFQEASRLVNEEDDYTLILNGGAFLNN